MAKAIKYICNAGPFYARWKKHFCPKCGNRLQLSYVSKIVNSKSPEAKNYDFSLCDTFLVGDVEFRTSCFRCEKCQFNISFKEMKKHEKANRKQ